MPNRELKSSLLNGYRRASNAVSSAARKVAPGLYRGSAEHRFMVRYFVLVFLVSLFVGFLGGCTNDPNLERENSELKHKLTEQRAQREAELTYMDRAASIAAACDWLIPLCPFSIKEAGYEAQRRGFSGGGFWFWAIAACKFGLIVWLLFVAAWSWDLLLRPAKAKTDGLRKFLADAENTKAKAIKAVEVEEGRLAKAQECVRWENDRLAQLRTNCAEQKKDLAELEASHQDLLAARAALAITPLTKKSPL